MIAVLFRPICDFLEQYWRGSATFLHPPGSMLGFFVFWVWHEEVAKVFWHFSWNCSQQLAYHLKKMPQLDLGSTALGRQVGANFIFPATNFRLYSQIIPCFFQD